MAVDLRIRPLGRPRISKDSALGFQRVSRRYVVEGPKVTKEGLDASPDGFNLFRPVGEADEEFVDHYLVNQQIEPGKTVDKAYLTREYAEIRNTWSAESITESGHLKRITRRYAVLRSTSPVPLGYSADSWSKHPQQLLNTSNDPWDFLPSVIQGTEPTTVSYDDVSGALYDSADSPPAGLLTPEYGGNPLGNTLNASGITLKWVRASVQVDMSNPGVDIWSVSWVAPVSPFWASGTGKGSKKALPSVVSFDSNGLTNFSFGSSGGAQVAYSYTFYTVGEHPLPVTLGGISSGGQPSVSMDFQLLGSDGNNRTATFRQTFSNAVWKLDTTANIRFPSSSGGDDIAVTTEGPLKEIFNYGNPAGLYQNPAEGLPLYQGKPIQQAGGHISWTSSIGGGSSASSMASSSITPVFSHGTERIWKISLTYIN